MDLPPLGFLAVFVAVSALLSLSSQVFSHSRKSRLKLKQAAENPGAFVFALSIWNLVVRALAVIVLFHSSLSAQAALYCIILIAAFIVCSEVLPAILATLHPEATLVFLFPFISIVSLPWKPLFTLVSRIRFSKPEETGDAEFRLALEEGEKSGAVESNEKTMVEGVLYLGDRPVSAFMIHRSEIQYLDIGADQDEVRQKVLENRAQGFFPVVRETQDNIEGIVSVEDILIALGEDHWKGLPAVMKPPHFIPETMSALKAFEAFKRENEHYLCVMDEYGGFAGTLRIRNLLEEIVGELTVSAPEEEELIRQEDGSWLADGSVSVDDLAKVLEIDSLGESNGDYHTLAGFILKLAGDIPRTGDSFGWGGYVFTVTQVDSNRIGKVIISKEVL